MKGLITLSMVSIIALSFCSKKESEKRLEWSDAETYLIGTMVGGCYKDGCDSCKGLFCYSLEEKVFSNFLDTRVAWLWNVTSGIGLVNGIQEAKSRRGKLLPVVGKYTLGMPRIDARGQLPEQVNESWFLHCERTEAGCTGQTTPECRCTLLFDLSLAGGINFKQEGHYVPNIGSISLEFPSDLNYGQNWFASKLGETLRGEPYDALTLDMFGEMWPVFSLYSGGVPYLAKPVELDYEGRIANARKTIDVLRYHLPEDTLVAANGGQIDMVLGRFLPSIEEGRPLPPEIEQMIQSGNVNTTVLSEVLFGGQSGATHPEWWDYVGTNLDMILSDGWTVFPEPISLTEYVSHRWADEVWIDAMNFALKGVNAGKVVGLVSDGGEKMDESGDLLSRNYSIGSFLLIRDNKSAYAYVSIAYFLDIILNPDIVPAIIFPAEADIPLGHPLDLATDSINGFRVEPGEWNGYSISGGAVYARKFENGVVFVNPSSQETVNLTIPEGLNHQVSFRGFAYLSTDGEIKEFSDHPRVLCTNTVESTILLPTTALIFLKEAINESDCPKPW